MRSFQYIEGIWRMMNKSLDSFLDPVNLGNPGEFIMQEPAEKVLKASGSGSRLVFKPLLGDYPTWRRADTSLAKKELQGWEPKVKMEEGLEKSITHFRTLI